MSSDQMPAPGKIKLIKFPPPGQQKTSNARGMPGGGGMLKLRFDWYINQLKFEKTDNVFIKGIHSGLWQNFLSLLAQIVVEQEAEKLFS